MPRKFHLSVPRKNEFRKAHAQRCTVSVQHISPKPENVCMASTSRESDEELIVSIPIDVVHDSGVLSCRGESIFCRFYMMVS